MDTDRYDLKELCTLAGVTPRTIHYYIAQGLLPAAGSSGPGAKYGKGYLLRLQLIRRLKREHFPLAEILVRMRGLSDEEVAEVLAEDRAPVAAAAAEPGPALDYVRNVLAKGKETSHRLAARSAPVLDASRKEAPGDGCEKSQWERVNLADEVELHIRRPLTRERNKQVERLLIEARRILKGEG